MKRADFFATWSRLHGDAEISGFVRWWLSISYPCARLFSRLRVTPNVLTSFGVLFSVAAWFGAHSWWALAFVLLALLADGLDGSLAIYAGAESMRGAFVDSLADRISEAFFFLTFYRLAPRYVVVIFIAWIFGYVQEYIRARAQGLGHKTTGIVTISERPVRVILLLGTIIAWHINPRFASACAVAGLCLQLIALYQLADFQRKNI